MDLEAIRARCSQNITEIVANPREYYRIQQILRDRVDLLAEVDRLMADIQELTCGDPRKVCPNCRSAVSASQKRE